MKCLCYSRCHLGPKYTLDFYVCFKCFGDVLVYHLFTYFSVQPQSLS